MKYIGRLGILVYLATLTATGSAQIVNSAHFEVYSSNQSFSEQVNRILEAGYSKASAYFQIDLRQKVQVFVTSDAFEFDRLVGPNLPDWSIACAIPEQNLIVLKSPDRYHYRKELSEVLYHELTHIFLGKALGNLSLPLWMNEGLAVWFSEKWGWGEKILVARAVLTGSVFSLSQIDSLDYFRASKAQLAYALSFLAVSYLETQYGQGAFLKLVNNYRAGQNLNQAFLSVTGLDYLSFQKEFEEMVRKRYNWIAIFSDSIVLWTGLALLFVLLYFVKKVRTKKILQRWEREEKGLAPRDSDFY